MPKPRLVYLSLVMALIVAMLALRIADPQPIARLRLLVFDSYQWLSARAYDPNLPVRIVDIDDESLRRIGQWPWPRTKLATLTARLAEMGAAAVAFDIVLSEPDSTDPAEVVKRLPMTEATAALLGRLASLPSPDRALAEALEKVPAVLGFIAVNEVNAARPASRVGFASAGDDPRLFVPRYGGAVVSLPSLEARAKGSGALNWVPEYDQIVRRLPVLVRLGDDLLPAFAAEALRVAQGAGTYVVKASGASGEVAFGRNTGITDIRVGRVTVPTDANGQMWLRFTESDPRRFISAASVLDGSVARSEIEGRIVLIGTSAAGLFDLRTTPLDASVAGVEVHAQAIEQMLLGTHLRRPDFAAGAELAFLAVSCALLAFAVYVTGAAQSALLGATFLIVAATGSWIAYRSYGWLFDPVYPTVAQTLVYIVTTVYLYLLTERERNRVRNAFSHYMAPSLVEELAAHPDKLKLGGEMREVTLMFADVRGFTSISERLDASQVTQFLNRLLTPLTDSITAHRGTIDKYMGDGIMAFWNAPLDDPEHERNAARAALAMLADLDALNREWEAEAKVRGEEHVPVRIGIGLNTAVCCVGNLGSQHRFDYSVIGDGVNLAARLEGQCKTYGVPVIAGESTAEKVPDLAFLEIDLLSVVGKTTAVRIYALLGDESRRKSEEFVKLKTAHMALLAAYRSRRFDEAERLLPAARALGGAALAKVYDLYGERIRTFQMVPPPPDWDGRAIAEHK
ncbi:MAG TPA: adenylate/guanylate cyclase domain-containing protein [Hyphomicrobiaceae bacterium]|nr:adenylate/guanylate cyclase domain-containing protein [Hyphomicrobiaceae bacterium]